MARSTGSCYQNPSPQNSKMGLLCGRGAQKWGVVISPPHPEGSGGSIPCLATTLKVKCRFEGLWRRPLMEWVLWLFEHAKGNICLQFWHDNKKNVIYIYITCNIAWFHPPNSPYDWLVLNKPFIITDFRGHTKGVWSHSQQRLELLLVIAWDDAAKAKMESRMASRKLDLKKSPPLAHFHPFLPNHQTIYCFTAKNLLQTHGSYRASDFACFHTSNSSGEHDVTLGLVSPGNAPSWHV